MSYLDSNALAGAYTSNILSYLDIALEPQIFPKVVKKFGKGLYMHDFAHMNGGVINVSNKTLKMIEEGAPERPVTCSIAITGAPLNDTAITFSAADKSDEYVRENYTLHIPSAYTNKTEGSSEVLLYKVGGDWKFKAFDPTLAITVTVTDKEFILGGTRFGYGTGQPKAKNIGLYERPFTDAMAKSTGTIEGGQLAQNRWLAVKTSQGEKFTTKLLMELEFDLTSQMDSVIFAGEKNTNPALTAQSYYDSATHALPSADGILKTMEERSLRADWTDGDFGVDDFDSIGPLLEGRGEIDGDINFMMGSNLRANIDSNILDWLSSNTYDNKLRSTLNKAGFNVGHFEKNGYNFSLIKLSSLSNPNKFGASEYPFKDYGFMFLDKTYYSTDALGTFSGTVGKKVKAPNFTLGFVNNNGENRRRVMKSVFGMNGAGHQAVNEYDGGSYYLLSHFMPIFTRMESTILVTK